MRTTLPRRPGRFLVWAAAALAVVFVALVAYQLFLGNKRRFVTNEELLAELADATFTDLHPPASYDPAAWPQWRGTFRDGLTRSPGLLTTWPAAGPKVHWRRQGGEGFSSFAVAGGRAVSMLAAGDEEAVVCWDLQTGKERWRHRYTPA